jgi:hypothetical protein
MNEPEEAPEEGVPEPPVRSAKVGPESLKDAELLYHRSTSGGVMLAVFGLLFFIGFAAVAVFMEETRVGSNLDFHGMRVTARRFMGFLSVFFFLVSLALFPMGFALHLDRRKRGLISIRRKILSRKLEFTPLDGAAALSLRACISVLRKAWEVELVYENGAVVHLFTMVPEDAGEKERVETALAKALELPVRSTDLRQG